MSLIVGRYYRGDPKQKPKQWGSIQSVKTTVLNRAESIGIPSSLLLSYAPVWEGCSNALDVLGFANSGGNQNWKCRDIQNTDGVSKYFELSHPTKFFDFLDDYTVIFWMKPYKTSTNFNNMVAGIGKLYTGISSIQCGLCVSATTPNLIKFYAYANATNLYYLNAPITFFAIRNSGSQSTFTAFIQGNKVVETTITNYNNSSAMGYLRVGLKPAGTSSLYYEAVDEFYGCLACKGQLNDNQIATLAVNKGFLIQPPTFRTYFDLSTEPPAESWPKQRTLTGPFWGPFGGI